MFIDLPLDIVRTVIESYLYLDSRQLSRLDVAFCNRQQRPEVLALFAVVKTSIGSTNHAHGPTLWRFLVWTRSRKVHVPSLLVSLSTLRELNVNFHVRNVDTVVIFRPKNFADCGNDMSELAVEFLSHFSSLKVLGCWSFMNRHQLLAIQNSKCKLEGLDLLTSFKIKSNEVASFACSLGNCLHVLKFHKFFDEDLISVAKHCQRLTTLDTSAVNLSSSGSLVKLCAVNSPTLTHLSLQVSGVKLITHIVKRCTCLVFFQCANDGDSASIVKCLLKHCRPTIATAAFLHFAVNIVTDRHGNKVAEILASEKDYHTNDQPTMIGEMPIPIRAYNMRFSSESITIIALNCLGERFGDSLESLVLKIPFADSNCICNLLERCPNLTHFSIASRSKCTVLNFISALPIFCRNLRTIKFKSYGDDCLEEGELLPFLSSFKEFPNLVTELKLVLFDNPIITEVVLDAVAETFPLLHTFNCTSGKVNKLALLDSILSGKLKAKRIGLSNGDVVKWISKELGERRVHHRWGKIHFSLYAIWLPLD